MLFPLKSWCADIGSDNSGSATDICSLTITTPDHLLYGSDYPYVAPQVLTQSLARMKKYLNDETDLVPFREMVLYQNANELFK